MSARVTLTMHTVKVPGGKTAHIIVDSALTAQIEQAKDSGRGIRSLATSVDHLVATHGYKVACGDPRMQRPGPGREANPKAPICKSCVRMLAEVYDATVEAL